MDQERCPHCGSIAYPDEPTCDVCGASLSGRARLSPYEWQTRARTSIPGLWWVLWPLTLLGLLLLFRQRVAVLPRWLAPVLAAAILVFGLPRAWRSRRPRTSFLGVFGSALVLVCFWLRPTFLVPRIPSMLPLVLLLRVAFVLPDAPTFHDPQSFKIGVIMIAVPLGSLWPMHAWIARLDLGFREFNIVLHGVALFFAVAMFIGGFWFLSEADKSSRSS